MDNSSTSSSSFVLDAPVVTDCKKNNEQVFCHYQLVASALTVLRNQLVQAQSDLLRLEELKSEAVADPLTYVDKVTSKSAHEHYKGLQKVVAIPHVNLEKYMEPLKKRGSDIDMVISPPKKPRIYRPTVPEISTVFPAYQRSPSVSTCGSPAFERRNPLDSPLVEERSIPALAKPAATKVAQRRPKGTRGPGIRPSGLYYSNRFSGASYLGTPTIRMEDEERAVAPLSPSPSVSDNEAESEIPAEFRDSEEYKELLKLKRLAKLKKQQQSQQQQISKPSVTSSSAAVDTQAQHPPTPPPAKTQPQVVVKQQRYTTLTVHHGYKCDSCGSEPIVGGRWKCLQCDELDLCDPCHLKDYLGHSSSHSMTLIETPEVSSAIEGENYSYLCLN
ncbi:hypothetical protein SmJEL517_g00750 [Synchytrium microbalum]|uniref:ZZ-type domain-containing protein n=1 Tax=Synchytrium microbalum TaxID=1806994 RepID=A0A507C7R7_9FUNG|nr:uncharacterized protein SmJEL517_g00750 [Synchytrium microbalum]TPX37620.1 hypothetical protein SmJEL517_g00750 [Synchytrium microbalum]